MRWWSLLVPSLSGCLVTDAMVSAYLDRDDDGEITSLYPGGTDCDDARREVRAGAEELCGDGLDNDCDGVIDDAGLGELVWYADVDGDGFGGVGVEAERRACTAPERTTSVSGDCDDTDPSRHPGAVEVCADGVDQDCSGRADDGLQQERWWPDVDGDGIGANGPGTWSCGRVDGAVQVTGDCDDHDPGVGPHVDEVWYDGVDADCDGADDYDRDGDGVRLDPGSDRIVVPWDPGDQPTDCDDEDPSIHPWAVEVPYDAVDADCDGVDDFDADRDGHRAASWGGDDCDDADAGVSPSVAEVPYDGVDVDCDPSNEDDLDGDGRPLAADCDDGDPNNWSSCSRCVDEDGDGGFVGCDAWVTLVEDCDDRDATRGPLAWEEAGDGLDADCDGEDFGAIPSRGVFVSPLGVDAPGCGTVTAPCRQPGYATAIAEAEERVLFLAGGDYEGFTTSVSVFGGFDPVTWARDPVVYRTWVFTPTRSSVVSALRLDGIRQRVESVSAATVPGITSARVVRSEAEEVTLVDVEVWADHGVDECVGIWVEGRVARLEGVAVRGCAAVRNSGIEVVGRADGLLTVQDSVVDVGRLGAGETTRGIFARGGRVEVLGASVWAAGDRVVDGVVLETADAPDGGLSIEGSEVQCEVPEDRGASIVIRTGPLIGEAVVSQSVLTSRGGLSTYGVYWVAAGPARLLLASVQIELSATETGTFVGTSGVPAGASIEAVHNTWISGGDVNTAGVHAPGESTSVRNTLLVGVSRPGFGATWRHCFFDSVCDGGSCWSADSVNRLEGSFGNLAGTSGARRGPYGLLVPAPESPLIDAGEPTDVEVDLRGAPRMLGGAPDIGAVEGG